MAEKAALPPGKFIPHRLEVPEKLPPRLSWNWKPSCPPLHPSPQVILALPLPVGLAPSLPGWNAKSPQA